MHIFRPVRSLDDAVQEILGREALLLCTFIYSIVGWDTDPGKLLPTIYEPAQHPLFIPSFPSQQTHPPTDPNTSVFRTKATEGSRVE